MWATKRALLAWLILIVAETVHGTLRGLFLVPIVGDLRARQIGAALGSSIILAIAWATVRWIGPRPTAAWLRIGATWTALTLLFEIALGRALGFPWARIAADYDFSQGGFMLIGIAILFCAPYLAARFRGMLAADV